MRTVLVVTGPDPELPSRLRGLLAAGATVVVCDVGSIDEPDPATVDALLRLALTARRCGGRIRLLNASLRLRDLLSCTALDAVLGVEDSGS